MERRTFVKTAIAAGVCLASDYFGERAHSASDEGEMPYRPLGRTGVKVSLLGLGGFHAGIPDDERQTVRLIRTAIDAGINFMDNSWDYHDGGSERRMGKALLDGYRQKVFLMTKIDGRTKEAALRQMDESLRRLQTDHLDLLQIHEVIRMEDAERVFAPQGAIEALQKAKEAGKIRFIGFTGHKDPAIHRHTLETARKNNFRFDAVQMPLNVMDAHFRSFQREVLPLLLTEEIGVLGMKPMGGGIILKSGACSPAECLQYAMSLAASTVITGMESVKVLTENLRLAKHFKPLNEEEMASLLDRTSAAATNGEFELFKTGDHFDATARNPEWLG